MMNNDELENTLDRVEKNLEITNAFISNRIANDESKIKNQRLIIICLTVFMIVSILANAFMVYQLSQYQKVTETSTYEKFEIEQNTGNQGNISNVKGNQYNDDSTHNEY